MVESLTVKTKQNPTPKYDFCKEFYKFPSYLRRTAISEAIGKVSSYFGNLKNWEKGNPSKRGKRPGLPHSEYIYQAMYRKNIFIRTDTYKASIKVFIRNTWDWLDVEFRKSDVDYIQPHCHSYKKCVPTLQKRGKEWFLDFVYQTNSLFRLPFLKISSAEIEGNNIKISGKATIENSKIQIKQECEINDEAEIRNANIKCDTLNISDNTKIIDPIAPINTNLYLYGKQVFNNSLDNILDNIQEQNEEIKIKNNREEVR